MSFRLPTFNVAVNVWKTASISSATPPSGPPDLAGILANVSLGRRVTSGPDVTRTGNLLGGVGIDVFYRIVMFPAATDVRGPLQDPTFAGLASAIEIPAGSGAYYFVSDVADMAKGFPNEHRVCWCIPSTALGLPVPLP